jgi:hypothetical protein
VDVAAQGFRTPFASPNGEQQGGFGVDPPPTCAGSSRWVPSLEGLGAGEDPEVLAASRAGSQRVDAYSVVPVGA